MMLRDAWKELVEWTREDALTGVLLWMIFACFVAMAVAIVYGVGSEILKVIA